MTSAGRWGWQIEMLSSPDDGIGLDMVEERVVHAWTERGARRKAQRMLRRRIARDRRQQDPVVVELDVREIALPYGPAPGYVPCRGTQTMATEMARGYEPPSMSLRPPIKRIP